MKKNFPKLIPWLIVAFYLLTHLISLDLLPVFADEAIYIRWTQLIIDDAARYLFFPLNDGKTPLFFWLMVPFQYLVKDQLLAGRLTVVLIGLIQVFSLGYWVKLLGGKKFAQYFAMILVTSLPYWFFHHRLALTDSLLVLTMTWVVIGATSLVTQPQQRRWVIVTSLAFGAALWSKLPALLLIPALPLFSLLSPLKRPRLIKNTFYLGLSTIIGFSLFYALRLHPAFPQLFSRGSDFLYPWREVIFAGKWRDTIINLPNYLNYFSTYLTWPVLFLGLVGLFSKNPQAQKRHHLLFWSAIILTAPIALLGRVVYARYLFPVSLFLTPLAALVTEDLIITYLKKQSLTLKTGLIGLATALFLVNIFNYSLDFMASAWTNPAKMNLVSSDKEQYLYEWSAGYGIKESLVLIRELSKDQTLAVATEGSFGTLPDGLLLYLHRQNVDNLYVEGIGYPVKGLTENFKNRAKEFDLSILLVNSHRLEFELDENWLITEFCRPDNAPCLQVFDITPLL